MNEINLHHPDSFEQAADDHDLNGRLDTIIIDAGLSRNNNTFFLQADIQTDVSINAAFLIAHNWRHITKNFLFSSIKGLGFMAEHFCQQHQPNEQALVVLQTAFSVIADDLNNAFATFRKVAPKGPKGMHYRWWEETILNPLSSFSNKQPSLSKGTLLLTDKMHQLSFDPLGVAVQLRIVEAIALDICIAFLAIFSRVEKDGIPIFEDENSKVWITTHIQAETFHKQQVTNEISGMTRIARTQADQEKMLLLAEEYSKAWSQALNDFSDYLKES